MSRSSEPKDGTVSASQGEIPSLTTQPPLVQQIETDDDDVGTTTPVQDIPRKGRLPPGFWPQEYTTVTEEPGRMEPVSTTADCVTHAIKIKMDVSNSHSTLDTWSPFLTFQDSGRTTRQAPPFAQESDHHNYSDYSEGQNTADSSYRFSHQIISA